MSKERLEELLDDLPYSIRHSGELEPLKQFAREQAELVSKHETRINNLTFDLASRRVQIKRYREVIKKAIDDLENECLWDALVALKELEENNESR